mgnify:CR=1 FL=1
MCGIHRKKLFASAGLPNIDQYNAETGADLRRLIFACDEVAEVLDRTGMEHKPPLSIFGNLICGICII